MKPDILYLWVNGQDEKWRKKRELAELDFKNSTIIQNKYSPYANCEGRFRDNNELRYSFRSLMPFINDFNNVFIVTDNQIPHWLDIESNSNLRLISHDVIRPHLPPTFSSKCIESYLHTIPELSENFLYLNDDVFFAPNFSLNDFFLDNGNTGVYFDYYQKDLNDELDIYSIRSKELLSRTLKGYNHIYRPFSHCPRALKKTKLRELEKVFPVEFNSLRKEIFRLNENPSIVADSYARYLLAIGEAEIIEHPDSAIFTGDEHLIEQLYSLQGKWSKLAFTCFNDTLDNAEDTHPNFQVMQDFMQKLWPTPSTFEK